MNRPKLLVAYTMGAVLAAGISAATASPGNYPGPTELAITDVGHFSSESDGSGKFYVAGVVNDSGTETDRAVTTPPQGPPKSVVITLNFAGKQGSFTIELDAKAHSFAPGVSGGASLAKFVKGTGAYERFAGKTSHEDISIVSNPYEYLPAGTPKPAQNMSDLLVVFKA